MSGLRLVVGCAAVLALVGCGGGGSDDPVGTWTHDSEGEVVIQDDGTAWFVQSGGPVEAEWSEDGSTVTFTIGSNSVSAEQAGNELTFGPDAFSGDDDRVFTRTSTEAPTPPTTTTTTTSTTTTTTTTTTAPPPADPLADIAEGDCVSLGDNSIGSTRRDMSEEPCDSPQAEARVLMVSREAGEPECPEGTNITSRVTRTDSGGESSYYTFCLQRL